MTKLNTKPLLKMERLFMITTLSRSTWNLNFTDSIQRTAQFFHHKEWRLWAGLSFLWPCC